jgi:two-component system OmpR family response regulator
MTAYDIATQYTERDLRLLGNIALDLDTYRVRIGDTDIETTYYELELLRLLLDQPDRIIGYTELTKALWGTADRVAIRHLNVLVHRLRTKLAGAQPYTIETVRGRGYGLLRSTPA